MDTTEPIPAVLLVALREASDEHKACYSKCTLPYTMVAILRQYFREQAATTTPTTK